MTESIRPKRFTFMCRVIRTIKEDAFVEVDAPKGCLKKN